MSINSMNMALIPYTPPKSPMEFIRSEVERGLANGSISMEQTIPHPISTNYLCWNKRTSEINNLVLEAFQRIRSNRTSQWGWFNGNPTYGIGGIKEHKLMKKIIREASPENKDFYALDIGAGNYQWGRALAEYLNKKNIPRDVAIHIIGIRGENNLNKVVTELGQCKLYEFGQFQIETLMDEFQKRKLQLVNKVDLVISRWCFRHLVDPVGTFVQAYDLLRPKTGHFLLDGFHFLHEHDTLDNKSRQSFNEQMVRLCLETRAPFLTQYYDDMRSLDHFIVRKTDDHPCHIYKQYLGAEGTGPNWQIGSETMTRFKELKRNDLEVTPFLKKGKYRGDKGMYEWLRQNGLLRDSGLVWGPLQEKDIDKKTPPLHMAIATGDEDAIYRCLQSGCDINESDDTGSTPLHLAITHNNYNLFLLLLEKGALVTLVASGFTPLDLAMQHDLSGSFITSLITAGVDPNNESYESELKPLDHAIKHKNIKAIELLLRAGAIVSYKNRKLLNGDLTFSSIIHLLPKKLSELQGFDVIIDYIQKGNCVFLTYPGGDFFYRFQTSNQLKEEGKLVRVTVNPKTRLLHDTNYKEIHDIISCKREYVHKDDIDKNISLVELQFGY